MKTIEEHNKEAAKSKVGIFVIEYKPEWINSGIMCPCGCEMGLLKERWPLSSIWDGWPVKCQKTGRTGLMKYSDSLRGIIEGIEWNK